MTRCSCLRSGCVAGEPLVVEQFQQGREALRVAVVRRGGEEELCSKCGASMRMRLRALGFERVVAAPRRARRCAPRRRSAGRTCGDRCCAAGGRLGTAAALRRFRKSMEVMSRGNGPRVDVDARSRRRVFRYSVSTMRKSRPNLSRISSATGSGGRTGRRPGSSGPDGG